MLAGCRDERAERIAHMQDAVREQLRDPESARFTSLRADEYGNALCGKVNSKNGYGGYAGAVPFYATDTDSGVTATIRSDDELLNRVFDRAVQSICERTKPL